MKRSVVDCDRCGKTDVCAVEISLCVDRTSDGAGSMSDDYETHDLCTACAAQVLVWLTKKVNLSHADAQWLGKRIKGAK